MGATAGSVLPRCALRKRHTYRIEAFDSGDAGVLARIEEGQIRSLRPWPDSAGLGLAVLPDDPAAWPPVEIVTSHAGARGAVVRALCAAGARGLVAACTGNGTLHAELDAALREAQREGVVVLRSSRCLDGRVTARADDVLPSAGALTPVQARIELMLRLMGEG